MRIEERLISNLAEGLKRYFGEKIAWTFTGFVLRREVEIHKRHSDNLLGTDNT